MTVKMTKNVITPKKGAPKATVGAMSLLDRAKSLPKTIHIPEEIILEPHERLSASKRRKNIEKAQKKGLIKATVR